MNHIFKIAFPLAMACTVGLTACSSDSVPATAAPDSPSSSASGNGQNVVPVDYSLGRAMNKRLGKGINLGNSWDANSYWSCGTPLREGDDFIYTANGKTDTITLSAGDSHFFGNLPEVRYNYGCDDRLDGSWNNPIEDTDFGLLKSAGFQSVRIPVRWQHNSNPETHTVSPERLAGVKEDVKLAIEAGLSVVISFHWYYEIMLAAKYATSNPDLYESELLHFKSIWNQVATAFEEFPDTMLVYDILNEPVMNSAERLNEIMTSGYQAIRAAAPGKTIMFESFHAAKFVDIKSLILPQDGNIIYSGHYYEPYTYSHQGHSYPCIGDAAYSNSAQYDLPGYVKQVQMLYPDINGGHVPVNMGEFGISGGTNNATNSSCKGEVNLPSAKMKAQWAQKTIQAAESYDISWHYWGFTKAGGFEAYDRDNNAWYDGFPKAFGL